MNKIFLLIILSLGVLLSACEKEDDNNSSNFNFVIVDANLYNNVSSDEFDLHHAEIIDDSIKITIRYGGGCGDVEVKLFDSGAIMESLPVQRNIRISFLDNDHCEAYLTEEFSFNLTSVRVDNENQVVLNLNGWDEQLLYEY